MNHHAYAFYCECENTHNLMFSLSVIVTEIDKTRAIYLNPDVSEAERARCISILEKLMWQKYIISSEINKRMYAEKEERGEDGLSQP